MAAMINYLPRPQPASQPLVDHPMYILPPPVNLDPTVALRRLWPRPNSTSVRGLRILVVCLSVLGQTVNDLIGQLPSSQGCGGRPSRVGWQASGGGGGAAYPDLVARDLADAHKRASPGDNL